jgi:exonuclease III
MRFRCRILSWNINGKVTDRILILSQLLQSHDLVLIQEHFLPEERQSLLPLFSDFNLLFRSAIVRLRDRPSGGLAILSRFPCKLLAETDYFIAAKLENHVVINDYLPKN